MKIRDVIKLVISILIIAGIVGYLYYGHYFDNLESLGWGDWTMLMVLTLALYFFSGLQMLFLVHFISGRRISLADVLFMPMSMSLFSYFIPTNGGIFYAVYYLKKKYDVESSQGFSVGVVSIYISFIIAGAALLVASLMVNILTWYLLVLSGLLMFSPILIHFGNKVLQVIPTRQGSFVDRVKVYLDKVITHSEIMMRDKKVVFINILITLGTLVVFFFLYYWLNRALKIQLPLLSIVALIAMMRISGLIRFLPGNLGLDELFTAGIFGIIGRDPNTGLVFSVYLRFCSVAIMIPAGILHTSFNSDYFSFKDVRKLLKRRKPVETA